MCRVGAGPRAWDGRGRRVLPATRPRARASPGPRPPLTRAGARLPDLQQQDDDGRQVGQVPGQPEDVHGDGGRRGGPRLGGSGSCSSPEEEAAKDGESGRDVARDVAELPARARGAAWESGRPPAPPRPRPLKGTRQSTGPAGAHAPGLPPQDPDFWPTSPGQVSGLHSGTNDFL